MATKTISLRVEAYERLKRAKRLPGESFSDVVLRASWPEKTLSAGELLRRCRERGAIFNLEELDRMERVKREDQPPQDKWKKT